MRKILYSSFLVLAVAAVAGYATYSFFSDTETSTGNTFTAGAIDLKVDSQAHYNGMVCTAEGTWQPEVPGVNPTGYPATGSDCGLTWGQTSGEDIVAQNFFDFADLKPEDQGESTISLHIDNNDAWACAEITITSDEDMKCTEPEKATGMDTNCVDDPINETPDFDGEIAENLSLAWWADDGDNILESDSDGQGTNGVDETQTLFYQSEKSLKDILELFGFGNKKLYLTLADSDHTFFKNTHTNGQPLTGSNTYFVGMAWCFGEMAISGDSITCDGDPVTNKSQTDKLTADISFSVNQARNNAGYQCYDSVNGNLPTTH